ncbi:hypothetical protein TNCV_414101 [Trichonephila clavipes]|nr:hypothetical protein TNCV_414101 [Trichonephila clavipes]
MIFESHSNSTHILLKNRKQGGEKRTPFEKIVGHHGIVETGHKSANPPHHVTCRRTQSHPVKFRKRGWPKNFTNVADRITIKAPPLMRDFGGSHKKKSAESPELTFTPFPCPALIRDCLWGGSHKKKVGGVSGGISSRGR